MLKSASDIAGSVVLQVTRLNANLHNGISRIKLAAREEKPPLSLMGSLGGGLGAGTAIGGGAGLLDNLQNIKKITQLEGRLPELEGIRKGLRKAKVDDRKILKTLLQSNAFPNETYYQLRKGYEKGLLERSRVAKTLRALKGMTQKSMLKHTLLGAGAGLGAGLLGATAFGHFD